MKSREFRALRYLPHAHTGPTRAHMLRVRVVTPRDTERTLTDSDAGSTMAEIVKVLGENSAAQKNKQGWVT